MSAANSRRHLRRENVRRLREAEPDLSNQQIGERLGISKDTVRRDLDALARAAKAAPAAPDAPVAPQVSEVRAESDALADPPVEASRDGADAPVALSDRAAQTDQKAQRAPLVRRLAGPLALPDDIDLRQWPAVRRDLATLAQTGVPVEKLVHDAIVSMAHHYRKALRTGGIERGQSFTVTDVTLRPLPAARRTQQQADS